MKLDASRIRAVYKSGDNYYVVYETSNLDYYRPFASIIPSGSEELDKLEYTAVTTRCREDVDYCPEVCLEDPYYDPACTDYVEVKRTVEKVWEKRAGVAVSPREEFSPSPEELVEWKQVTPRNVRAVVEGLAGVVKWDGKGTRTIAGRTNYPEGEVVEALRLENPFFMLELLSNPVLVSSSWDEPIIEQKPIGRAAVILSYHLPGTETITAYYKAFDSMEDAKKFFNMLKDILKPYQRVEEEKKEEEEEEEREEEEVLSVEEAIKTILQRLPEWADAAVIVRQCFDFECEIFVYPAKKSKYGEYYYYSPRWRTISIPYSVESFLEPDTLILKSGKRLRVKIGSTSGKYESLIPA